MKEFISELLRESKINPGRGVSLLMNICLLIVGITESIPVRFIPIAGCVCASVRLSRTGL